MGALPSDLYVAWQCADKQVTYVREGLIAAPAEVSCAKAAAG